MPFSAAFRLALSATTNVLVKLVQTTIEGRGKKYHPEQHYMRGPGPKWREKRLLNSERST
jgi:hypothetical protein